MLCCHFSLEWVPNSDLWNIWASWRLEITVMMDDVLWKQKHKDLQSRMPDSVCAEERDFRGTFILRHYLKCFFKSLMVMQLVVPEPFRYVSLNAFVFTITTSSVHQVMSHWDSFSAPKYVSIPWTQRTGACFSTHIWDHHSVEDAFTISFTVCSLHTPLDYKVMQLNILSCVYTVMYEEISLFVWDVSITFFPSWYRFWYLEFVGRERIPIQYCIKKISTYKTHLQSWDSLSQWFFKCFIRFLVLTLSTPVPPLETGVLHMQHIAVWGTFQCEVWHYSCRHS